MDGNDIREWRRVHGYSRAELARALPVAYPTLRDWECGYSSPPRYVWRALAHLASR